MMKPLFSGKYDNLDRKLNSPTPDTCHLVPSLPPHDTGWLVFLATVDTVGLNTVLCMVSTGKSPTKVGSLCWCLCCTPVQKGQEGQEPSSWSHEWLKLWVPEHVPWLRSSQRAQWSFSRRSHPESWRSVCPWLHRTHPGLDGSSKHQGEMVPWTGHSLLLPMSLFWILYRPIDCAPCPFQAGIAHRKQPQELVWANSGYFSENYYNVFLKQDIS